MDYKHDRHGSSTAFELFPAAGKRLYIRTKGIGLIRLPLPMSQSEISIYGEDGSPAYVATKERTWSGRWVLSSPKQEALVSLACLPGGRPLLRRLNPGTGNETPSIELRGKWTSRAITFAAPEGRGWLEWKYVKTKRADGETATTLRLYQTEERGGLLQTRPVAELVRPSGCRHRAAGQGGRLDLEAATATGEVDEALVVASCLAMLRRERDRLRFVQAMVIGTGGS